MAATHCQNLHEYAEGLSFLILQKHWWVKLLVLTPGVCGNCSFVRIIHEITHIVLPIGTQHRPLGAAKKLIMAI